MKQAFEAAHKSQFGFIDPAKELVIEAVSVEAVGGGAKFSEPVLPLTNEKLPSPARRTKFFSNGAWHDAAVYTRDQLAPGHRVDGPAIVIEPHQTIIVEDGWQAELTAKNHLVLARIVPLERQHAIGTQGRSGDAGSVQQPLHVDRRADGRVAAEHRLFGQHQGAARLLLRGVRRRLRRSSPMRRTCRCISARWTARSRPSSATTRASIAPGDVYAINAPYNGGTHLPDITVCTPVFAEAGRALASPPPLRGRSTRIARRGGSGGTEIRMPPPHPPQRGGSPPRQAERTNNTRPKFCSGSRRAATMPTSAASRPARCRRTRRRSRKKASTWTTSSSSIAAASARRSFTPRCAARNIRRAIRCRTSTTSRRRSPPTRRACRSCARWWRISRCRW